jgi:predicted dehydrogenase
MPRIKSVSRRHFLKLSSTAAVAPFILPSHIWAAETKPNDRIALGHIGMGTQNRGLMNGLLRRDDCQVVAVCDVEPNRREAAQKTANDRYAKAREAGSYKGCDTHADFREVLARKDIDAVVIATPDHWHALISIAAANAGKDIYCEKPLCQSIHEARAMVNAVRRNQRVFQTGSMQRSSREFRVACELVRNNVLGKIHTVEVNVGGPAKPCDLPEEPLPAGTDWNMWLGPAALRGYNEVLCPKGVHKHFPAWRNYREFGGGGVTDWGAHHFDIAQWGLGMDASGPVEVIPADQPNATQGVKLRYADGAIVTHGGGEGVTFHGPKGRIMVNRGKFKFWMGDKQIAEDTGAIPDVMTEYLNDRSIRLYESSSHQGDFVECIRSRKKPIADVEIGARTVTVCHLVNLSYYHDNAAMKWDPAAEQFVDGKGDPGWLDVPYRAPWKLG